MRKIFLIKLFFLICCISAQGNVPNISGLDPEDTWEYLWVDERYPLIYDEVYFREDKVELFFAGNEVRDGEQYMRFNWKWKNSESCFDSYYLLREENGAYYVYIDMDESVEQSDEFYSDRGVKPGEYLLYDFNMEEGETYSLPCALFLSGYASTALSANRCYMGDFTVTKKEIDSFGRRCITLEGIPFEDRYWYPSYRFHTPVRIVEGVGPVTGESNLAALYFPDRMPSSNPPAFFQFYRVMNPTGEEVFLNPQEASAGFIKEREYEWVYGLYNTEGDVSYMKMKFNYVVNIGDDTYRRLVGTEQDEEWKNVTKGIVYLLREVDGKIYLYHNNNSLVYNPYVNVPAWQSLIYDFGAADGEELTFYSPEGEKSAKIATGLTEVDGEDKLCYTFEGSDGVKCVEGIGITKGGILPAVNTEFHRPASADDESFVGAVLVAVYDGEGNLIFRQDLPDAVEAISASEVGFTAPADRLYDLQGRELSEPIPGQPYIRGGQVFVETK